MTVAGPIGKAKEAKVLTPDHVRLVRLKYQKTLQNKGLMLHTSDYTGELALVKSMVHRCPYCDVFFRFEDEPTCIGCPLDTIERDELQQVETSTCCMPGHPYDLWETNQDEQTCQALLDLIDQTDPFKEQKP